MSLNEYKYVGLYQKLKELKTQEYKILNGHQPSPAQIENLMNIDREKFQINKMLGNHQLRNETNQERNNRFNENKITY